MELNLCEGMEHGAEDLPVGKKKAGKPFEKKDKNKKGVDLVS
jgi:hypothetical protein